MSSKFWKTFGTIILVAFTISIICLLIYALSRAGFESVIVGPPNGQYVVRGVSIDRDGHKMNALTEKKVLVVIKFAAHSDTPVTISPGAKALITVHSRHLIYVEPIETK